MTYLIMHIWLGLLITFVMGLILGYILGKNCKADSGTLDQAKPANDQDSGAALAVAEQDDVSSDVDLDGESYAVETLEGIGKHTGQRFREAGISTVGDVLRQLRTPEQRQSFAETMGMKVDPINEWACQADILRIDGMDHQFAELVLLSGAKNVQDVANQNAKKFTKAMCHTNQSGRQLIAPIDPEEGQVKDWIKKAKKMKAVVQA